jgi:hypothetical protein
MHIASAGKETGALLKEMLTEYGVYNPKGEGAISYGMHLCDKRDPKILNGVAARGKIYNMQAMTNAGVRTVPWFMGTKIPDGFKFPAFARRTHGCGGEDLMPVFQPCEVPWRASAGWDWFSSVVPFQHEYRLWVFRGEVLDAYAKVMQRPSEYKFMGRNFRNGFEFQCLGDKVREAVKIEAINAVKCLDLDFGAVDMLYGEDGKPYILECNTAPGVIRSGAQATLKKLAARIAKWAQETK